MATIIDMPKLSDTMTVGTLAKWLKKEGDAVKSGIMIAEIETDKATMELECFENGVLLKQLAAPGSQIPVGAPICVIGKAGEDISKLNIPEAAAPAKADTPPPAEIPCVPPAPTPVEAAPVAAKTPVAAAPVVSENTSGRARVSPLARKVAAEKGIDPTRLTGTGPAGRVVRADVLAAAANPASSKAATAISGAGHFSRGAIQEERTVPVSTMRGVIAKRLVESKQTIPHFYLEIEIDAEPLAALRTQLNNGLEKDGVKLSVNDFILKASAEALRRVPDVNAAWEGSQIRYFAAAHVSFAVALPDGLITPVIRDAHQKSVFQISTEAKALGKAAKEKKLKPDQFTGGTFCVSNLGMMGIPKFSPIVNPPNAAILGVGSAVTKPVVKNGQLAIGSTLTLTLSCDHRVVDGAVGAQYLGALKLLLESPALLLV